MKKLFVHLTVATIAAAAQLSASEWLTNLPKALAQAKKENKLVMLDFQGSDWCPPCKALHKNVLISKEFEEYADKNLVLVDVDFPNKNNQPDEVKKANAALQTKFKIEGFPTVIVLGADGKELKRDVGYGGAKTAEFIANIEKAKSPTK